MKTESDNGKLVVTGGVTTTYGVTRDDKAGIMAILGLQLSYSDHHTTTQENAHGPRFARCGLRFSRFFRVTSPLGQPYTPSECLLTMVIMRHCPMPVK